MAKHSLGNTVNIYVKKGSKLENVYLDNIYYNDLKLTKNDITSS